MSQSGAVYQPTTVTYEGTSSPQGGWTNRPISYLSSFSRTPGHPCRLPCFPIRNIIPTLFLILSTVFLAVGIVLILNGAINYGGEDIYLILTISGALLFTIGIVFLGLFLRQSKRNCCRIGKDPLDPATGQALTVNPSTDLLVAAQYAPVPEVAYQPPNEESEQSKLMPQTTKERLYCVFHKNDLWVQCVLYHWKCSVEYM
ncbi:uncharacterized protein LOC108742595 isoform X2 [Agrilus planipennis]|nr:uncharacterized protein LOC108742595 isoform X2 [Agrilus planipennis]